MGDAQVYREKRVYPRVEVSLRVKYKLIEDPKELGTILKDGKKDMDAQTMDISLSGMYIVSDKPLKKGNLIRIDIPIDAKGTTLPTFAEVMWAVGPKSGLQFLSMKEEDAETLKAYLDSLSGTPIPEDPQK